MTETMRALLTCVVMGGGSAVLLYTIDMAMEERAQRKAQKRAERARRARERRVQTEAEKQMHQQIARNRDELWAKYVQEVQADERVAQ